MSAPKDSKNYYEWKRKIKIKFNTQEYKEKQRLAHLGKKNNKLSETLKRLYKEGKIKPWDKGIKRLEFSGKNNPMNIPVVRERHLQAIKNSNTQKRHLEAVRKPEYREKIRKIVIEKWKNSDYRNKMMQIQKERCKDENWRKKISKINKDLWQNPEYREKKIKSVLKGLMKRPTSYEQKIIDLCKKHNLPFDYVGDGKVIINYVNPDFINNNGQKQIIETYAEWCHPKNYEETRAKRFSRFGFRTLFLNDNDLLRKDWEQHCLKKIEEFSGKIGC